MARRLLQVSLLTVAIGLGATAAAQADCEGDLEQLEQAYKAPNLTAPAGAALDEAKVKAVAALKKDDDNTCHAAVTEGMSKAGLTMK